MNRIKSIRSAVGLFNLRDLPSNTLPHIEHNASARIIRNGLAVQCFNTLEDFMKARMAEVLSGIDDSSVRFVNLPNKFKTSLTCDVLKAILFQSKFQPDQTTFVQDYCERIASTKSTSLNLSDLAFFHSALNVGKNSLKEALEAFSIDDPWKQITDLTSRVGLMTMPAASVFQSLAEQRHSAAHDPSASTSESDLNQSLNKATALAFGFDVLLSHAACLIKSVRVPITSCLVTNQINIILWFIKYENTRGIYYTRAEGTHNNIRVNSDPEELYSHARAGIESRKGALLVYDEHGSLKEWWTC